MPLQALVVDDQKLVCELAEQILTAAGYEVATANDWRQAFDHLAANVPALILLDIMLPERDGIDIYREIRGRRELVRVPILLMSAGMREMPHGVRELNDPYADFVKKPFGPAELMEAVSHLRGREPGAREK